jgi:hypothetical protein
MDARDAIADSGAIAKGISNLVESIAQESGIYSRLAALEMLLYPTGAFEGSDLLGTASAKVRHPQQSWWLDECDRPKGG